MFFYIFFNKVNQFFIKMFELIHQHSLNQYKDQLIVITNTLVLLEPQKKF